MADESTKKMANEEDELAFDPSMKKKKKAAPRKKSVSFEDPESAQVIPDTAQPETGTFLDQPEILIEAADNEEDMFAGLKKKKAKKPVPQTEDAPAEAEGVDNDLDFSSLKKKKKKRVIDDKVAALEAELEEAGVVEDKEEVEGEDPFSKGEGEEGEAQGEEEEGWLKSDRDYTYEEVRFPSITVH
jgi:translation initiation factor 2 subunit 2